MKTPQQINQTSIFKKSLQQIKTPKRPYFLGFVIFSLVKTLEYHKVYLLLLIKHLIIKCFI